MTAPSSPVLWPGPEPEFGPGFGPAALPRRRAAAFTRADLLGAISVLSLVSLLGLPLAWVWAQLAPAQLSVVQEDGVLVALPPESQHRFDDLALFVLLGLAAGVLSGVALWLLRSRRGPVALLALAAGSLVAAWLAMRTGVSFAQGSYGDAVRAAVPAGVVQATPRLESAWVLVAQPLAAVLTYGVATALNGLDDLGRRLS